ncbi:MAG: TldD/PmbA family protein [Candidatus Thorarchaeota archaeon]
MMEYDNLNDELLSIIDTSLKYAKSLDGSAEFEVFIYYESSSEAEIDQGVVTAKDGVVTGNAVRAAKGQRVGFACASGIHLDRVKLSAREALSIIDTISVEDDRFKGFCEPRKPGREGVFAKEILELGTDDLIEYSLQMVEEAQETDPKAKIVSAECSASWGGIALGNTLGIQAASRTGMNSCLVDVIAMDGEERKSSFDLDISRERLFETAGLGERAAKDAVRLLGAKKIDTTVKMPTIWTPEASALYIRSSIGRSVMGQPVVEGISPLCDMLGDTVASSDLTIVDDGQNPTGLGTHAIDGEGHPQQRNVVVDKGVLKSFLFDSYYGRAFELESTGNCSRGGGLRGGPTPYESSPSVSTKWLRIEQGKKSIDDLVSEVDGKGVMIMDMPLGISHSNVSTGEFSVVANSVLLIENGEIKGSLEPVSIAGQFYEGFKNLLRIGSDATLTYFGAQTPSLLFDDFSVTG